MSLSGAVSVSSKSVRVGIGHIGIERGCLLLPLLGLIQGCSPEPAITPSPSPSMTPVSPSMGLTQTPALESPVPGTPSSSPTAAPLPTRAPTPAPAPTPTPWIDGPLSLSGAAYFFWLDSEGGITQVTDVEGAEVYIVEMPAIRTVLTPENQHTFTLSGVALGATVTLALVHPQYFPLLTATFQLEDQSLEGITFQAIPKNVAYIASPIVGIDLTDETLCHMATTVTALGGDSIWAEGEPGATVTLEPAVPAENGPIYFNTNVLPDPALTETTTDGGVAVAGVEPGVYLWTAHKEGVVFAPLVLTCVAGWLTNASPPYGLNVLEVLP